MTDPNLKTYRIMDSRLRRRYIIGDLIIPPALGLLCLIFLARGSSSLVIYGLRSAAYLVYVMFFVVRYRDHMNMELLVSDEGIGEREGRRTWRVDWSRIKRCVYILDATDKARG